MSMEFFHSLFNLGMKIITSLNQSRLYILQLQHLAGHQQPYDYQFSWSNYVDKPTIDNHMVPVTTDHYPFPIIYFSLY